MFQRLYEFVSQRMRMSHVYQPLMLMKLLSSSGRASDVSIARCLLIHDQSQIEYYTKITNNMVGRVLRNHGLVERDRKTRTYHLIGYEELSPSEIRILKELCQERLDDFISRRGDQLYSHRRNSDGYVSGTIRYNVLKRARFRCELCGISAAERALQVDHIVPRNHGGSDDISNLQALCYVCNAMKRDQDDTDFRSIRDSYSHREKSCLFCTIPIESKRVEIFNELAYMIHDEFAVTSLHSLIIPKRHVRTYFELGQAEINACNSLLLDTRSRIEASDRTVSGFNIGMNNGESAGQTILHCHIHLIPRRNGDVENPRGGVRHVFPGKGYYPE